MESPQWVPTVNDLRVKLCYICREEEQYDHPDDPPRAWTHPCSCTLVAHESCLLQWIKSAQQDAARAANALKCPQCGATYDLESDNPLTLRILNAINGLLSTAGKAATVCGFVGLTASFGFTIYVVSTSYGAFAIKEFLGEGMYNLLLTDDPSNWPWHAFIHLPIIPFSLILSRTRLFDTFPIIPLFLTWSTSPPIRRSSSAAPTSPLASLPTLTLSSSSSSPRPNSLWTWPLASGDSGTQVYAPPPINWPPTPLMGMILFPFIRIVYRRLFARLTKYVMGAHGDASIGGAVGPIRRVIWALNEDGPAPLRVRIGANIEPAPGADGQRAAGQGAAQARQRQGDADGAAADAGDDLPDDPAVVAERTLHVTTSSLGRFVGGALLVPSISARMGSLLFKLSKHSSFLRTFLAIQVGPRAGAGGAFPTQPFNIPSGSNASLLRQIGTGLIAGINVMFGGTPTWNSQDPVWWRNAVGLGLFVFAKDCVRLIHLYLTKRELESRKVKSRSFAGVDIKELDLINPLPQSPPEHAEGAPLAESSTSTGSQPEA